VQMMRSSHGIAAVGKLARTIAPTWVPASLTQSHSTQGRGYSGVIVGGGVIGCSMLYHLSQRGIRCILFEKGELTCGATWHAAGLVTRFHGGNNFRLWHDEGVELFHKWQAEGAELSFNSPGSIRLIPNDQAYIDEAKAHMGKAKIFSSLFGCAPHHMISPAEIRDRHPLANFDDSEIYGGILTEHDGHIDPTSVTNAFAKRARDLGGVIEQHTEVVDLDLLPSKRWVVTTRTSAGDEKCTEVDFVINCGGLWCDRVGHMAGVQTPSVVLQHQYVITDPIPEVRAYHMKHGHQMPVLRDLKGSFYLRDEGDGILIGPYESQETVQMAPAAWRENGMPLSHANYLFDGDVDRLLPHLETALELIPQAMDVGLKTVLNGPTMWPADGNHLVGPAPRWDVAPNFWMACAESYGIAHSAGLGRYLAEWIDRGEPPYELKEADPARYGPWATPDWIVEKVSETYGMNNHPHFPNENLTAGRPVQPLPNAEIYDLLEAEGCQFGFHNGYEGPNFFMPGAGHGMEHSNSSGSFRRPAYAHLVESECRAMASFAGICYWPFSKFIIKGPRAAAYMDHMVSNRLPNVGRCALSYLLTPQGRIGSEIMLARIAEDEFYVVSYPEQELHEWRWFHMHKPADGVDIQNITADFGTLMVAGPESRSVLGRIAGDEDAWSAQNFKFYQWRDVELAGVKCRALRVSFTGELGWELHAPTEDLGTLYKALKAFEPRLCNWGGFAMGSFRLERGYKAFGSDLTRDHLAPEALEKRFLREDKDYIGRNALAVMPAPTRRLVHMSVDTPEGLDCVGNEPIFDDRSGDVVGFTTSGGYGYLAKQTVAFGYVQVSSLEAPLSVEVLGDRFQAKLQDGPFTPIAIAQGQEHARPLARPTSVTRRRAEIR